MNKKQIVLTFAGIAVALTLFVVGFVAKNFFQERNVTKVEQDVGLQLDAAGLIDQATARQIAAGAFIDGDSRHKGTGQAKITELDDKLVLVFSDDFSVTSGPDLLVYLSKNSFSDNPELGDFVSLGDLQSDDGEQVYNLPENYEEFASVVIWCRAFGVLFSYADLEAAP